MLVFIDESGDPGFKLGKGSTAIFAVAMIIVKDPKVSLELGQAIIDLQTNLGIKPEFKFNRSSNDIRDRFFESVRSFDFRVRALVVPKGAIYSAHLRANKEAFYQFFVKNLLKFDNGRLQGARVVIDGSGERTFRRDLQAHLRRHTVPGAIKDIRMKDSKADPLVQLADMCVGAIARSYRTDRPASDRWRQQIRHKIDDVWTFG